MRYHDFKGDPQILLAAPLGNLLHQDSVPRKVRLRLAGATILRNKMRIPVSQDGLDECAAPGGHEAESVIEVLDEAVVWADGDAHATPAAALVGDGCNGGADEALRDAPAAVRRAAEHGRHVPLGLLVVVADRRGPVAQGQLVRRLGHGPQHRGAADEVAGVDGLLLGGQRGWVGDSDEGVDVGSLEPGLPECRWERGLELVFGPERFGGDGQGVEAQGSKLPG